jgi:KUP system potassium uptake protein
MAGSVDAAPNGDLPPKRRDLARLSLLALGVVFGDIGTSPLYAMRECFHAEHGVAATRENVFGVLSLIVWSLVIVISIKYLIFILRADNRGEGGILALMAMLHPGSLMKATPLRRIIVYVGLFGAALLYGDGVITPAVSVLGAIEGLEVATPSLDQRVIIPVALAILLGLFAIQKTGTGIVGTLFGPITIVWFVTIAALGAVWIVRRPDVLAAVNPIHALEFFGRNGWFGYLVLGSVFLVVTGGEALYSDIGHFGTKPIRLAWFVLVFPALLLNYFGQGAWLLEHPTRTENTFYALAPSWFLFPLVGIATLAACIASQAVISGVFSLTRQAVQLGYLPRVQIDHTSERQIGQIYIGSVNWIMFFATAGLVIGFQSASNLAAAYGVAVSLEMVLTTVLFFMLAVLRWKWNPVATFALCALFFSVEAAFFGANMLKVLHGGWFPLALAAFIFTLSITWKRGREVLAERVRARLMPLESFLQHLKYDMPARVKGTAIFMSGNIETVPIALLHNLKHNQVLHERVIFLTVQGEDMPYVPPEQFLEYQELSEGFHRVVARYGFMEEPDVPRLLKKCASKGLHFDMSRTTFFLGRETILATKKPAMAIWREKLFAVMTRNALSATAYFRIPPERVIEVGAQVEI